MGKQNLYVQEGLEFGLIKLLCDSRDVYIVCSDMAKCALSDDFLEAYGDRIIDLGIAEQNAVSFCGGLASQGIRVIYITFACFLTRRAFDQLYNSIALPNYRVFFIGLKAGLSEAGGASHLALNDISLVKSLPNFYVFETASALQLENLINSNIIWEHPTYLRLVYEDDFHYNIEYNHKQFNEGFVSIATKARNVILVSGRMLSRAIHLCNVLKTKLNIEVSVVQIYQIFPISLTLSSFLQDSSNIFVIEEHSNIGGLYDEVLRMMHSNQYFRGCIYSISVEGNDLRSGNGYDLLDLYGLNVKKSLAKIRNWVYNLN